jgi:23S rRNA (cytosine1962-C5)-methyltransferase
VWSHIDVALEKGPEGKQQWTKHKSFKEPWTFAFDHGTKEGLCDNKLVFSLHLSPSSKNIGVFPEQAANWIWMMHKICTADTPPRVLNLFGYTGGATLAAAAAGASVCHVDASAAAVTWARNNQELSKLKDAPIRWIVDDCAGFVGRESRRSSRYDALILDPPAFGRNQKGRTFEFEKQILKLLGLCRQVLVQDPLFVIFNGYSMGYSATVLKNLLGDFFPGKNIEFGELQLQEQSGNRCLPCSLFARFARE